MREAAKALEFEKAAEYRDRIRALEQRQIEGVDVVEQAAVEEPACRPEGPLAAPDRLAPVTALDFLFRLPGCLCRGGRISFF